MEIHLDDLEQWYESYLAKKYAKLRKNAKKILEKIVRTIYDMRNAIDRVEERGKEVSSEIVRKTATRFVAKMRELFNSIEVPEKVTYDAMRDLVEEIKRVFLNLQSIAKQSYKKFGDELKPELKEIQFHTRKLSELHVQLDSFMRKKYADVKGAEGLISKTEKLYQSIEKITSLKQRLERLERTAGELEEKIKEKEEELLALENLDELKRLSELEAKVFRAKNNFRDLLRFRKVLNKVKTSIDKGTYSARDVTSSGLREYLKDPVEAILREGENHPKLTNLLVQIRYGLEQGLIPLKKVAKDKVLDNINQIVGEKVLRPKIGEIMRLQEEMDEVRSKIEKEGWLKDRDRVRDEIAQMAAEAEHLANDTEATRTRYRQALEKLKEQRELLQESLREETKNDIKIQITFSF